MSLLAILAAGVLSATSPTDAFAGVYAPDHDAWVEMGPQGAEARALAWHDGCPEAEADGKPLILRRRAEASADLPAVCSALVPAGARSLRVDGIALEPPKRGTPKRVVIIGDTGCRIKGPEVQACNDPDAWPLARLAAHAAARKPDLVIHVGDYYYRETPCPAGDSGCAGSPYGDRWPSWRAEFFTPLRPLMQAAPWVVARGNHESCARGGKGWVRLFDPLPYPADGACPRQDDAYTVRLGALSLHVLDSAETDDRAVTPEIVGAVTRQLDAVAPELKTPGDHWLLTHRPFWALVAGVDLGPLGVLSVATNLAEQAAARARDLSGLDMVVSGHIHHFEAIDFGAARPAQLVVGTGGDVGDPADPARIRADRISIDGLPARHFTFKRYGYLVLDRQGDGGWAGAFYDIDERRIATCRIAGRSLRCHATP